MAWRRRLLHSAPYMRQNDTSDINNLAYYDDSPPRYVYRIDDLGRSYRTILATIYSHLFHKLDHFINIHNVCCITLTRSSLEKRKSWIMSKKYYEIDPLYQCCKTSFSSSPTKRPNKLECLSLASFSIICKQGRSMSDWNIRPGWKCLTRINALAYLAFLSLTKKKPFVKAPPTVNLIKLFGE